MALELCNKCGWMHYPRDPCREPKKIAGERGRAARPSAASPNITATPAAPIEPKPEVRAGVKFVAQVPEGTKLVVVGDKVIAAGPNLAPHYVTDDGLVPITPKDKRKGDRHRAGYWKDYKRKGQPT